tara:strand:- start:1812 stop:2420 length:609 start_codon:yes stop_codon:yes gene_type:complete
MKKIYIFDLDGVLIDSRLNMKKSWEMVNKKLGYNIKFEKYFSKIGLPFQEILTSLGVQKNKTTAEKIFKATSLKNMKLIKFYPGVKSTLKKILKQGNEIAVITSKDLRRSKKILNKLKLNFSTIQSPRKSLKGKPNKDLMIKTFKETGFSANSAFYIGDTMTDYNFAKKSKVKFIFAKYGYHKILKRPFDEIKKISEILKIK